MRWHRMYNEFENELVPITKQFFEAGPWVGGHGERMEKFQKWWNEACDAFGYEQGLVVHIRDASDLFRIPPGVTEVVQLHHLTVTELFHAFRHEMQIRDNIPEGPEACQDAHAWSCSLYFTCRPLTFCKSVLDGKIPGVSEVDLVELDDSGCALHPAHRAEFERIAETLLDDIEDDPEFAALLDQFNGEG